MSSSSFWGVSAVLVAIQTARLVIHAVVVVHGLLTDWGQPVENKDNAKSDDDLLAGEVEVLHRSQP